MLQVPELRWDADPSTLHTLILIDVDVPPPAPVNSYLHYLVTNIPGTVLYSKNYIKTTTTTICKFRQRRLVGRRGPPVLAFVHLRAGPVGRRIKGGLDRDAQIPVAGLPAAKQPEDPIRERAGGVQSERPAGQVSGSGKVIVSMALWFPT